MRVLDLQEMDAPEVMDNGGGGGDVESSASLLLCDSLVSFLLCNN